MRNTRNTSIVAGIALAWIASACDPSDITNINNNPNNPTDAPAGAVFTNAVSATVGRFLGSGYSLAHTELVSQHLAQVQYPDEDRYQRLDANSTAGHFNNPYTSELIDFRKVVEKGRALDRPGIYAPALIMQTWTFGYMTDTFGDIPYTTALGGDAGGSLTPEYDSQQEIYNSFFATLDTAAADLETDDPSGLGGADQIFDGDLEAWQRFANSLHARFALRIVNADPPKADAELRKAFTAPGGVFRSNADNAELHWPGDGVTDNSWANTFKTRDDHRLSKTLMNIMLADNDPRIPIYAQPTVADPTKYAGMPNGLRHDEAQAFFNIASRPGAFLYPGATAYGFFGGSGASAPSFVMTYAEVAFIQAEAAERSLGGLAPGQAAGFYENAIRASMDQWGVADQGAIDAYLARPNVAYKGGTEGLKQIAVQKWIALFTNGGQAWAEWRRTCQPATIAPGPAAVVNFVPRRFHYSTTEISVNASNLQAAVARQGPDNFGTRVWWDKSPSAAPTCS
jgi:hypothetical protein